ncbi:MAG: hypothetical protein WC119_00075 [Synergistaceae bacterium]
MSIYSDIKKRILECMKSGEAEERDILRTLIGEIQSKMSREGKNEADDTMVEKTLISFKENAYQSTLEGISEKIGAESCTDAWLESDKRAKIEIAIYEKFLPSYESVENIIVLLEEFRDRILSAKSDGPAVGMAMGFLKSAGKKVQGKDVSEAVAIIRKV